MQDAASEVQLRDEEGDVRSDFLHAVSSALEEGDTARVRALTLGLHEADLADLIQLLRPEERAALIAALGDDFKAAALPELDEGVRDQVLEEMPAEQVAEVLQQLELGRSRLSARGSRRGRAEGHSRQASVFRAHRAPAEPRIPGRLRRPHHADRSHRRAAVLVGGADDRLYARGLRPSRPFLRDLRRGPGLSPDRLGGAQSPVARQAADDDRISSPKRTSARSRSSPTRRRWRGSSSATT